MLANGIYSEFPKQFLILGLHIWPTRYQGKKESGKFMLRVTFRRYDKQENVMVTPKMNAKPVSAPTQQHMRLVDLQLGRRLYETGADFSDNPNAGMKGLKIIDAFE